MLTKGNLRDKVGPFAHRASALSHVHRLSILYLLAHDSMRLSELVAAMGVPENLVAHHAKQLVLAGWIKKGKKGKEVVYMLQEKGFLDIRRLFEDTWFYRTVLSKHFR